MKTLAAFALCLLTSAAHAAPATYKKTGPDAAGISQFWVKCEDGNVSIVQCLKDEMHCGADSKLPLAAQARIACAAIVGIVPDARR